MEELSFVFSFFGVNKSAFLRPRSALIFVFIIFLACFFILYKINTLRLWYPVILLLHIRYSRRKRGGGEIYISDNDRRISQRSSADELGQPLYG